MKDINKPLGETSLLSTLSGVIKTGLQALRNEWRACQANFNDIKREHQGEPQENIDRAKELGGEDAKPGVWLPADGSQSNKDIVTPYTDITDDDKNPSL